MLFAFMIPLSVFVKFCVVSFNSLFVEIIPLFSKELLEISISPVTDWRALLRVISPFTEIFMSLSTVKALE